MGRITINQAGIAAALRSPAVGAATRRAAERTAAAVRAQNITVGDVNGGPDEIPLPVHVYGPEGADQHCTVVLAHAAGAAVQAKHGALTKAATEAGLRLGPA